MEYDKMHKTGGIPNYTQRGYLVSANLKQKMACFGVVDESEIGYVWL